MKPCAHDVHCTTVPYVLSDSCSWQFMINPLVFNSHNVISFQSIHLSVSFQFLTNQNGCAVSIHASYVWSHNNESDLNHDLNKLSNGPRLSELSHVSHRHIRFVQTTVRLPPSNQFKWNHRSQNIKTSWSDNSWSVSDSQNKIREFPYLAPPRFWESTSLKIHVSKKC